MAARPLKVAIPRTLKVALPTVVPTPMSLSVRNVLMTLTNNSGVDVAMDMNVAAATSAGRDRSTTIQLECPFGVAVISAKNYKRQRRKRQSVTAKREKSQTPKVLTAILTLPNLT